MGYALRITPNAKMGPLVAALAAIAAGTLVAVTVLGQSLGPIPVDNPAFALRPTTGGPLVIDVVGGDGATPSLPGIAGVLAADQPAPVPAAAADDLLPNRSRTGESITSITEEEYVEPVPPERDLMSQVQQRISEIVRTVSARDPVSALDERVIDQPERRSKRAKPASVTARVSAEPGVDVELHVPAEPVAAVKEEVLEVTEEVVEVPEGTTEGTDAAQPVPPTDAGSASPVL